MKIPIKMDDFGVPLCLETSTLKQGEQYQGLVSEVISFHCILTRWALPVQNGVIKRPHKWATGVTTPISGVITLLITIRCPLCRYTKKSCFPCTTPEFLGHFWQFVWCSCCSCGCIQEFDQEFDQLDARCLNSASWRFFSVARGFWYR